MDIKLYSHLGKLATIGNGQSHVYVRYESLESGTQRVAYSASPIEHLEHSVVTLRTVPEVITGIVKSYLCGLDIVVVDLDNDRSLRMYPPKGAS